MATQNNQIQVLFLPFMAQGHMIPTIDMAKLFGSKGIKTAIIATHLNSNFFYKSIQKTKNLPTEIQLLLIEFPCEEANLPQGCESLDKAKTPELFQNFFKAITLLQPQIDKILQKHNPKCLIADTFFPWATDLAAKYGIPRLVFHGTCFFSLCAASSMILYEPHKKVSSDTELFTIPNLPDEIKLTRNQVPGYLKQEVETEFIRVYKASKEADVKSYGILVNSFYELEPDYALHFGKVLGRKAWHIGPVSLCNKKFEDKLERGIGTSTDEVHECLRWLDSNKPNSVLYICFGSLASFSNSQLLEISIAIEASGCNFLWVVKEGKNEEKEGGKGDWLPEGFEERNEGKGMIVNGWAPQVLILEHEAIGGFVTHCGWNSVLEAVTSGMPMVTWPVSAEQFYNEKLVTDVLRIGVAVGANKWGSGQGDKIGRENIEKAVKKLMVDEEGKELRRRAKGIGDLARKAVEEGGSSYLDLNALVDELGLRV